MRVLVTGAAGYIGTALVPVLLESTAISQVIAYDNFGHGNYALITNSAVSMPGKLRIIRGDMLDSRRLQKLTEEAELIVHMAAIAPSPFNDEHPHLFDQVNHWGTAELSYAIEQSSVRRVIYLSSGAVYGARTKPFSHQDAPMPVTSYGASKLDGERQLQRLQDRLDVTILRIGTVYGISPSMRFDTLANRFLLNTVLREPLTIHGSGEQHRPMIHMETLLDAVLATVSGEIQAGTYDVLEDNYTVNDVVEAVRQSDPAIETLAISQNQRLKDLVVERDARLSKWLTGVPSMTERMQQTLSAFPTWHGKSA